MQEESGVFLRPFFRSDIIRKLLITILFTIIIVTIVCTGETVKAIQPEFNNCEIKPIQPEPSIIIFENDGELLEFDI